MVSGLGFARDSTGHEDDPSKRLAYTLSNGTIKVGTHDVIPCRLRCSEPRLRPPSDLERQLLTVLSSFSLPGRNALAEQTAAIDRDAA
jgi:hypothetical protein